MPDQPFEVNPTRATLNHSGEMPHDSNAERSVLSAMLLSPDAFQECILSVRDYDFYIPSNRTIYNTIRKMFDHNEPIDPVSLADALKSQNELERVGGMNYLLDLVNDPFALASWQHHAEILRRDTTLRQLIATSAQISALAFDAPEDTKEVVDQAERMLLSVTQRGVRSNYSTLQDVMGDLYNDLSVQAENPSDIGAPRRGQDLVLPQSRRQRGRGGSDRGILLARDEQGRDSATFACGALHDQAHRHPFGQYPA